MKKEIEIRAKENDSYKLILKLELNEEDEELLKKRFNLLALSPKLNNEQNEVIETLFGWLVFLILSFNVFKWYILIVN